MRQLVQRHALGDRRFTDRRRDSRRFGGTNPIPHCELFRGLVRAESVQSTITATGFGAGGLRDVEDQDVRLGSRSVTAFRRLATMGRTPRAWRSAGCDDARPVAGM
jgi:hypothetical protein